MRVKNFQITIKNKEVVTEIRPFNEHHAGEIGEPLYPDGLSIGAANRLCEKWNRVGAGKYVYKPVTNATSTPVEQVVKF